MIELPAATSAVPTVILGDALVALRTMPDRSVDAVVTDPPYGLTDIPPHRVTEAITRWAGGDREFVPDGRGFDGHAWDRFVPPPAVWDECLRVLRPGGHLAVFSGARTQDLMGMSIRMAGFEIRDTLAWISASRFPKGASADKVVGKHLHSIDALQAQRWTEYSSTLKPALEPIILARRPLDGTLAQNLLAHGTGALHTDAVRVPFAGDADEKESKTKNRHGDFGTRHGGNNVFGDYGDAVRSNYDAQGRFPPNVLLDEVAAAAMDAQSGITRSTKGKPRGAVRGDREQMRNTTGAGNDDVGGASRFFPRIDVPFHYAGRAPAGERPVVAKQARLRLRRDLTPEQVALVRSRLREAGVDID